MTFPVNSTSVITPACKQFSEVLVQKTSVARFIHEAGVFSCRKIHGSTSWSQHAFGNACDFFAYEANLYAIARNFVAQATRTTPANKGHHVPIAHVIWNTGPKGIWTPDRGWHPFTGYHPPTHVHVDFDPPGVGIPACAR